jgi:hypothetical protein
MHARLMVPNTRDIRLDLMVSMTFGEWKVIRDELKGLNKGYSSTTQRFSRIIENAITKFDDEVTLESDLEP